MTEINDWSVVLGFDSSKVDKGIQELDGKFQKFGQAVSKKTRAEQKQLQTVSAQNSLRRKMLQAEKIGVDISGHWNTLNKGSLATLKKKTKELDTEVIKHQRLLVLEKKKNDELVRQRRELEKNSKVATAEPTKKKMPGSGLAQSTRIQNRSFDARVAAGEQIEKTRMSAERTVAGLEGVDDVRAKVLKSELNKEIKKLNQLQARNTEIMNKNSPAYKRWRLDLSNAKLNIASVTSKTRELSSAFNAQKFAAEGLSHSLKNMARSYLSVFAAVSAAGATLRIAKDFDRIRAVMKLSSESAVDAEQNFEFVRQTSERLGSDISSTADAFAGFNVSAMSSGLSAEQSKTTFSQLATSIQATGLDAHRSGLAFLAFKQMLAGPVIQAQEMNQVVEQMPQFTGIARQALKELGHEGENFRNIIATGTVDSQKFVTAVAKLMETQAETTGAAAESQNNLIAAQNRFNNSLKEMADTVSRNGLKNIMMEVFGGLAALMKGLTPAISLVVKGLSVMVSAISMVLTPLHELLQSLGLDGGLASVLLGIAAIFSAGTLFAGLAKLITLIRSLAKAKIVLAAVANPLAAVGTVAAATAAAFAVDGLFDAVNSSGSRSTPSNSTSNVNTDNRTVNNYVEIHSVADSQELVRRVNDMSHFEAGIA